jgi:hypothetical protein
VTAAVKNQIKNKREEINKAQEEIKAVAKARAELEKAGADDLRTFGDHIAVLSTVWRSAHGDAEEIKRWLEKGALDAVSRAGSLLK